MDIKEASEFIEKHDYAKLARQGKIQKVDSIVNEEYIKAAITEGRKLETERQVAAAKAYKKISQTIITNHPTFTEDAEGMSL